MSLSLLHCVQLLQERGRERGREGEKKGGIIGEREKKGGEREIIGYLTCNNVLLCVVTSHQLSPPPPPFSS